MAESKELVWCIGDNPLRIVCMLESAWSMGHLFRDVLYIYILTGFLGNFLTNFELNFYSIKKQTFKCLKNYTVSENIITKIYVKKKNSHEKKK